jgi:hypothetical protein
MEYLAHSWQVKRLPHQAFSGQFYMYKKRRILNISSVIRSGIALFFAD